MTVILVIEFTYQFSISPTYRNLCIYVIERLLGFTILAYGRGLLLHVVRWTSGRALGVVRAMTISSVTHIRSNIEI